MSSSLNLKLKDHRYLLPMLCPGYLCCAQGTYYLCCVQGTYVVPKLCCAQGTYVVPKVPMFCPSYLVPKVPMLCPRYLCASSTNFNHFGPAVWPAIANIDIFLEGYVTFTTVHFKSHIHIFLFEIGLFSKVILSVKAHLQTSSFRNCGENCQNEKRRPPPLLRIQF